MYSTILVYNYSYHHKVLLLDGADLLAKDEDLFIRLMRHAKVLVNDWKLIIVSVSSEEPIVCLLEEGSEVNRSLKTIKVFDI